MALDKYQLEALARHGASEADTKPTASQIDILEAKIEALTEYMGVQVKPIADGVYEVVKPKIASGDYLDPIHYELGDSVLMGLWYYMDDKDLPHEAIASGKPYGFGDRNFFDFVD